MMFQCHQTAVLIIPTWAIIFQPQVPLAETEEPGLIMPSESGFICMQPSAPLTDGKLQLVACLSHSKCGPSNNTTIPTSAYQKQVKACQTSKCSLCKGDAASGTL